MEKTEMERVLSLKAFFQQICFPASCEIGPREIANCHHRHMRLLAGCCWLALSGVEAFQLGSFNLVRPKLASPEPQGACVVHDLDSALSTINKAIITSMKGVIDFAYNGRDIQRFYVLETIARVPYFSYLSCLHLYETLGMRKNSEAATAGEAVRGAGGAAALELETSLRRASAPIILRQGPHYPTSDDLSNSDQSGR